VSDCLPAPGADSRQEPRAMPCCPTLLALLLAAAPPQPEPGFTPLFNGKDLAGWHVMNGGRFSVPAGVIVLHGGSGWVPSDKQYKDFELRMEFRFVTKGANSGIFFRASKDGKVYPAKNYQVQTMDHPSLASVYTAGLPGAKEKKDAALLKKVQKPAGQWQTYAITARRGRLEVKGYGAPVTVAERVGGRDRH